MEFKNHRSFLLADKSYASLIKKEIRKMAEAAGFAGSRLGEVEIVASEIISNLIKHSDKGAELLAKNVFYEDGTAGIELISIDNGPGMLDPYKMLADGISTTKTLGQGLGAMKRLSDDFDIYSQKDWGTLVLCRLYINKPKNTLKIRERLKVNTVMVPKPGEDFCGDGWAMKTTGTNVWILATDGLGHGPDAYKASQMAVQNFLEHDFSLPSEVIVHLHEKIKSTRGIVGSVMLFDQEAKTLTYCGVGNISARVIMHDSTKSFISYNGIIGMNKPATIHDQKIDAKDFMYVIFTSDGIVTRWDLNAHPGLVRLDNSLLAAYLYKDYSRRTDDILIISVRISK
ncbi:MAG: ATP-binding protein [Bacteroidia bacterium]